LGAAITTNPLVPTYLLGVTPFPDHLPTYVGIGDDSEAVWCAATIGKVWLKTPNAIEWMAKIFAGGLEGLPRPETGDGPAFFLNPYESWGLTRCPECDELTKVRKRHLALTLEPDTLLTINISSRMCDSCDIIFLHERDVLPAIAESARERGIALIDQDFLLLGVVDRAAFSRRQPLGDDSERQQIVTHLHRFREERVFEYNPYGWAFDAGLWEEFGDLVNDPTLMIDMGLPPMLPGS
jgi:hypothetical protein